MSLAALSQATVLADYAPLLSTFVSTAALNITASLLAKGDNDEAVRATTTACIMAITLGLVMSLVVYNCPDVILKAQGVRGEVLKEAVTYCRGRRYVSYQSPKRVVEFLSRIIDVKRINQLTGLLLLQSILSLMQILL